MNKIRLISIASLLAAIAGCNSYGKVKSQYDSFKNKNVSNVILMHKSEEEFGLFSANARMEALYATEGAKGMPDSFSIKMILPSGETSDLQKNAFIQVNDVKHEVQFTDIDRSSNTRTSTKKKRDTQGRVIESEDKTKTTYRLTGKLVLKPGLLKQMAEGSQVAIRVYIDTIALTFPVTAEDRAILAELAAQ